MQRDRHPRAGVGTRPALPDSASDPLIGRTLDGRYRIESRIARGGMAGVYQARDLRLDRTVAVKVMHTGLGDDRAYAARFVREARAAARLNHPNVVSIFDQGEDHGTLYLAMELVRGSTLRETITARAPLAPARALALIQPVLTALAAAHHAGLVHRDVKPENVLISEDARSIEQSIKVADFGLARAVTAETQHTSTGVLIGTVSYIAPEIVTEGRADERADVYSAGVLLYEMLTGRKPHEGDTPIQVAYKHVHEDVPPPSRAVPGIPDYVDALVARATARDPELRPADAGVLLRQVQRVATALADGLREDRELTADLALPADRTRVVSRRSPTAEHAFEAASPQPARISPAPVETVRPRRRRRWRGPILTLLAVLLAAGVGTGAWWYGYARYTSTPGVLGQTEKTATSRLEGAGLVVEVGSPAYSETVKAGHVISTDPAPGDRVLDGATVTLTLSQGVEEYQLPDLAGMSLDDAQDKIQELKMAYGTATEKWSETVAEGQVIRSDPTAGQVLRPGTVIDVVVSRGRKPIELASWVGKSAATATSALEKRKLNVETDHRYDDDVPEGMVISQSPDSGTTLYKGDTVSLMVSDGPELVTVPSVKAWGVEDATAKLKKLGFKVTTANGDFYLGLGYVSSTDPAAGTKIPKGSTVTLYLV
ncbi:Stk1 family PASTA domain-containing Ser/Thr kinase [Nocardioides sp.]|uniref:Stk1 family PASTA domain-containing Ser/Thr kinase n=1 Tax=Nocardioides sp. TaxID=35761 RepID=UPI0039E40440